MFFKYEVINSNENIKGIRQRCGNCKSSTFPCSTVPKSIGNLWNSPSYTGHDLNLGSIFIMVDTEISKPLRIALLAHYGKYINVVSSASSMHRPDLFDGDIDNLPSHTTYGISFVVNLRLIKRIVPELNIPDNADVSIELKEELHVFIHNLKEILTHFKIAIPATITAPLLSNSGTNGMLHFSVRPIFINTYSFILHTNLIIAEQFLRYTDGLLLACPYRVVSAAYSCESWGDDSIAIGGVMSKKQATTMYNQRKNHKRHEWGIICNELKIIVDSEN
jgi:hypothetical protein